MCHFATYYCRVTTSRARIIVESSRFCALTRGLGILSVITIFQQLTWAMAPRVFRYYAPGKSGGVLSHEPQP
jgi:hypothetical protein